MSATVSKDGDHWYCSVTVEFEVLETPQKVENVIGIDLGLSHFATTSNGEVFENPRHLQKSEKKLKKFQRKLSRARHKNKKTSKNQIKKQLKLYKLHRKVRNQRKDFLHKLTHHLITKNDVICIEDLNVKGMVKNKRLSKSISNVAWSEFVRQLTYKALWYGKTAVKIDRFAPSSQVCNGCGNRKKMKLSQRTYKCSCGHEMDRDLNASRNILDWGINTLNNNRDSESQIYAFGDTSVGV